MAKKKKKTTRRAASSSTRSTSRPKKKTASASRKKTPARKKTSAAKGGKKAGGAKKKSAKKTSKKVAAKKKSTGKKSAGASKAKSARPAGKTTTKKKSASKSPTAAKKTSKKTAKKPSTKKKAARPLGSSKKKAGSGRSAGKTTGRNTLAFVPGAALPAADAPRLKKTPLSRKQLNYFRELLRRKRAEIIGDVTSMETEALRGNSSGEISHMPTHSADVGSDAYDQDFLLQLAASERETLKEIDAALVRIAEKTYGICEVTGQAIGLPRLEAKPWARLTIEAARERDRRMGLSGL